MSCLFFLLLPFHLLAPADSNTFAGHYFFVYTCGDTDAYQLLNKDSLIIETHREGSNPSRMAYLDSLGNRVIGLTSSLQFGDDSSFTITSYNLSIAPDTSGKGIRLEKHPSGKLYWQADETSHTLSLRIISAVKTDYRTGDDVPVWTELRYSFYRITKDDIVLKKIK